jgi:hypothetical protein
MAYDDGKFGVVERVWFGLNAKSGGSGANPYTFGTTDATTIDQVQRHYFRGPVKLKKFGYMVLATVGGGGTAMDVVPARLMVSGSNESSDINIADAAAPWTIASTTTFTNDLVPNGSYIHTRTGTPQSAKGTAANTATTTGSVAFFVDYVRQYRDATGGASSEWDR